MTTEVAEAWDRLLFHLENQTAFWFAMVVGDDARTRAQLREAAQAWCSENHQPFILHEPEPSELPALAIYFARAAQPGLHWIRADGPSGTIERWDSAVTQLVLAMNERRDAYRKRVQGGVILEGRESLKRITRDLAPDLFSIRAFIAEPGMKLSEGGIDLPEWRPVFLPFPRTAPEPPDQALERAKVLERESGPGAKKARVVALVEAIRGLLSLEKPLDEVEPWMREAAKGADELADELPDDPHTQSVILDVRFLLGRIAYMMRADSKALTHYDEAIAIAEHLTDMNDEFVVDMAALHRLKAALLHSLGKWADSVNALRTLLRNLDMRAERTPSSGIVQLEIILTQSRLAEMFFSSHNVPAAEEEIRAALSRVEQDPPNASIHDDWLQQRAQSRVMLGQILSAKGDLTAALESYRKAFATTQEKAARHSMSEPWQSLLQAQYQAIGNLFAQQDDHSDALASYQQGLSVIDRWLLSYPDNVEWKWRHVACHCAMIRELLAQADTAGADGMLAHMWDTLKSLPVPTPIEIERAELVMAQQPAFYRSLMHLSQPARARLPHLLTLLENWISIVPANDSFQLALAKLYEIRAAALELDGDSEGAREIFTKAQELREELVSKGIALTREDLAAVTYASIDPEE